MYYKNRHSLLSVSSLIFMACVVLSACSMDGYEPEKPFTTCPTSPPALVACGINSTRASGASGVESILFTETDIEWFDVNTREIKFKDVDEPLYKRLEPYREIKFYLGDNALFVVSSFVSDLHSMIFTDIVLHYDMITDPNQGHYYLHDCYPPQFINDEQVKANRASRAEQWSAFTKHLESRGKLKK